MKGKNHFRHHLTPRFPNILSELKINAAKLRDLVRINANQRELTLVVSEVLLMDIKGNLLVWNKKLALRILAMIKSKHKVS